jgi:hypothetical protein
MLKTLILTAAMALAATSVSAQPYKLDAAGKCRDAKGAFTAQDKCKGVKPVQCKNDKGAFAKCGTPGAKPVSAAPMAAKSMAAMPAAKPMAAKPK